MGDAPARQKMATVAMSDVARNNNSSSIRSNSKSDNNSNTGAMYSVDLMPRNLSMHSTVFPHRVVFLIDAASVYFSAGLARSAQRNPSNTDSRTAEEKDSEDELHNVIADVREFVVKTVAAFEFGDALVDLAVGSTAAPRVQWGFSVIAGSGDHAMRRCRLHSSDTVSEFDNLVAALFRACTQIAEDARTHAHGNDGSTRNPQHPHTQPSNNKSVAPPHQSRRPIPPAERIGRALRGALSDFDWSGGADLLSPVRDHPGRKGGLSALTHTQAITAHAPNAVFVLAAGPRSAEELAAFVGTDTVEGKVPRAWGAPPARDAHPKNASARLKELLLSSGALVDMYAKAELVTHWADVRVDNPPPSREPSGRTLSLVGESAISSTVKALGGVVLQLRSVLCMADAVPFGHVVAAAMSSGSAPVGCREWALMSRAAQSGLGAASAAGLAAAITAHQQTDPVSGHVLVPLDVAENDDDSADDATGLRAFSSLLTAPSVAVALATRAVSLTPARTECDVDRTQRILAMAASMVRDSNAAVASALDSAIHAEANGGGEETHTVGHATRVVSKATAEEIFARLSAACEEFVAVGQTGRPRDFASAALRSAVEALSAGSGMSAEDSAAAVTGHVRKAILIAPRSLSGAVQGRDRQRERLLQAILRLELGAGLSPAGRTETPSTLDPLPTAAIKEIAACFFAMSFASAVEGASAFGRLVADELAGGYRLRLPQTVAEIYNQLELGRVPAEGGLPAQSEPDTPIVTTRTKRRVEPRARSRDNVADGSGLIANAAATAHTQAQSRGGALHRRPIFLLNGPSGAGNRKKSDKQRTAGVEAGAGVEGGARPNKASAGSAERRKRKPTKCLFADLSAGVEKRRSPRIADKAVSRRPMPPPGCTDGASVHVAETPNLRRTSGPNAGGRTASSAGAANFVGVKDTPIGKQGVKDTPVVKREATDSANIKQDDVSDRSSKGKRPRDTPAPRPPRDFEPTIFSRSGGVPPSSGDVPVTGIAADTGALTGTSAEHMGVGVGVTASGSPIFAPMAAPKRTRSADDDGANGGRRVRRNLQL